ncbi:unnamed protein product [Orchesella dallaii]|uniref:Odorant receptor n=1 Tax=Orchesella dallaii TaxID=48710 RepID=A0ABP1RJW1_9HEXA
MFQITKLPGKKGEKYIKLRCPFTLQLHLRFYSNRMSLTIGALNVFFHLQKHIPPPFHIQPGTLLTTNQILRHYSIQNLMLLSILYHYILSACRLLWLLSRKTSSTDLTEHLIYLIVFALCGIGLASYFTLQKYQVDIVDQLKQRFRLVQNTDLDNGSKRKKSFKEIFVYVFSFLFATFPYLTFCIPYQYNFDPLQLVFNLVIKPTETSPFIQILIRVTASIIYGMTTFYGAGIVLSVILFAIIDMEGIAQHSSMMNTTLPRAAARWRYKKNGTNFKFRRRLLRYQVTRIWIRKTNTIMGTFMAILVATNTFLHVTCSYVTIKLYYSFPLLSYLACPFVVFVCLLIDVIYFTLAAAANRNGRKFVGFWRYHLFHEEDWRRLRACRRIGYSIGPMKCVDQQTAFAELECKLSWTVSASLIG